jgi:hypothetical protein
VFSCRMFRSRAKLVGYSAVTCVLYIILTDSRDDIRSLYDVTVDPDSNKMQRSCFVRNTSFCDRFQSTSIGSTISPIENM